MGASEPRKALRRLPGAGGLSGRRIRHAEVGVAGTLPMLVALLLAATATAAPPQILSVSVVDNSVSSTGVTLQGSINPNGSTTTYRFEYLTLAAYEGNLAVDPSGDPFAGASLVPSGGAGLVGSGTTPISVSRHIGGLTPATAYRFRLRATNSAEESALSAERPFATEEATNAFSLLDDRGWEMVSPIAKNGGEVQAPGTVDGGGVFQAAAAGSGQITYSSANSFSSEAAGAPGASQYLASRTGAGWATADLTAPLLSGSYGSEPDGVPYQLFSSDLSKALLSNGERCRGDAGGPCPVANPPLPGSGAPPGYRNYYLRDSGGDEALIGVAGLSHTTLGPAEFELRLAAATPDLSHVVLSSCAALSATAVEVAAPGGCDEAEQNLYEFSAGGLTQVNLLPGQGTGAPGAKIAASAGAISADGSRVYWSEGGDLYLRDGTETKQVDLAQGGGGEFQAASADGALAYFTDAGDLLRFSAQTGSATALSAAGEVEGVLGASEDGRRAYYATPAGLFFLEGASSVKVAGPVSAGDYPPATGTSRTSADGAHLVFLSAAELTGYPSEGATEVFLYGPPPGGGPARLLCVSCNPTGERPVGSARIPGARPNGRAPDALAIYKPRALSASGNRVFFESPDPLVARDTNHHTDVYEWEAAGIGSCSRTDGCVQLISGGQVSEDSAFLDAGAEGQDAYFLTPESLDPLDPGSGDVYDARVGGGFALPESRIPCDGDACQLLPEAPEDPVPGTLIPGPGNPPLSVSGKGPRRKHNHKKHHRKKHHHKKKKHGGRHS